MPRRDINTPVDWKLLRPHARGAEGSLKGYGYTTLGALQLPTEGELSALRNMGQTKVDAVKLYLESKRRRLRLENEGFATRARKLYGSVLGVPCNIAECSFNHQRFGAGFSNLFRRQGWHTLKDLSLVSPDEVADYISRVHRFYGRYIRDDKYGRRTPEQWLQHFIEWLAEQGVWKRS